MIKLVKVVDVESRGANCLWLRFSDHTEGVRDLSDVLARGGIMVEPLRDPAFFRQVFVESGVPTWPNGFDLDAINLHMELERAGLLRRCELEHENAQSEARSGLRAEE